MSKGKVVTVGTNTVSKDGKTTKDTRRAGCGYPTTAKYVRVHVRAVRRAAGLVRAERVGRPAGDGRQRSVMTYYPGTPEMGSATRIEVGRATEHSGFDFVVGTE